MNAATNGAGLPAAWKALIVIALVCAFAALAVALSRPRSNFDACMAACKEPHPDELGDSCFDRCSP